MNLNYINFSVLNCFGQVPFARYFASKAFISVETESVLVVEIRVILLVKKPLLLSYSRAQYNQVARVLLAQHPLLLSGKINTVYPVLQTQVFAPIGKDMLSTRGLALTIRLEFVARVDDKTLSSLKSITSYLETHAVSIASSVQGNVGSVPIVDIEAIRVLSLASSLDLERKVRKSRAVVSEEVD